MSEPLTTQDLEAYLASQQIDAEIVTAAMATPTVEAAAEAVRVSPDQIVKSLLFLVEDQPVLVVASGVGKIDRRLLGEHFGVNRRQTRFADRDTVLSLTGYPVGAVPPVGHRERIQVLVDPAVLEHDAVYGGGGSESALMRINPQEILRYNQAEVVSIQKQV
ncbi:MAG: YbaK/EbsC family protein [Anaerolineales bacterium]|jgi:prolyl-tRNA editing enzyme YbaK/EbsC (Cys-tRNA(Pro) deacylase)